MNESFNSLDQVLTKKCQEAKIPGMALVVAKDGKPIFEKYYGYRDVEKKLPVNGETVFGIASITKSFTTLAVMQLADKGKLSIFDPVIKWLPEFTLVDDTLTPLVTIHHLMTHTTGLPGLPLVHQARATSIRKDPDGKYLFGDIPNLTKKKRLTVRDLLKLLKTYHYDLLGKPGEVFNYSNESYAFLQEIIERASGQSLFDYMYKHIFAPLAMKRVTFLTEDLIKMDNVTELYAFTQDRKRDVFHSPAWWDVGDIYTNGSLKTSALDLIKYLEVYRQYGEVQEQQILSKKSVQQMTIPQISTPNGIRYGYGLQVQHRFKHHLIGHGGSIKGVSSQILLCRATGLSVVVLTNIADVDAEDLAMLAMQYSLGITEEDKTVDDPVVQLEKLENYVGYYKSLEGNSIHVSVEEGELKLTMRNDHLRARAIGKNLFLLSNGKKIAFTQDEYGTINGLYYSVRYLPKVK